MTAAEASVGKSTSSIFRVEATGDGLRRAAFTSRDHDEKLHEGIIDLVAATLNDKDILITDGSIDTDRCLAVTEFPKVALRTLGAKPLTDSIDEPWVRRAGEYLDLPHGLLLYLSLT